MTRRTCTIDGCTRPVKCRGLCPTHYQRFRVHGDPTVVLRAGVRKTSDPADCVRCADVAVLAGSDSLTNIARRVGHTAGDDRQAREMLMRHLRGHGQIDLADRLQRLDAIQRDGAYA